MGSKLLMQFLMVALLGTALGGIGVWNLLTLQDQVENTFGQGAAGLANLLMLSESFLKMEIQTRDLLAAAPGVKEAALAEIDQSRAAYQSYHDVAITHFLDDMDKYNFSELDLAYGRYTKILDRIVAAQRSQDFMTSQGIYDNEGREAGIEVSRRIHVITDYSISASATWSQTNRDRAVAAVIVDPRGWTGT